MPAEVWPELLETLRLAGPLSEDAVRADVGWWLDQVEHKGATFPTSRRLAARWGWGRQRVRTYLKRSNPLLTHEQPTANPRATRQETVEAAESGTINPLLTHEQPTANPELTTRVGSQTTDTDPTTDTTSSQLALTAPESKPDHWEAIRGYLITERNRVGAARWTRSAGLGKDLARIIKQVGPERTRQLIDLAYDSQAFKHRMNRESGKGHPSITTLRRHAVEYLEEADEQGLNQAATVAGRPSWDELIAWYDSGSPRGETRRFLNTLPGGWERWQAFLSPRMRERHARTYAQLGGQ